MYEIIKMAEAQMVDSGQILQERDIWISYFSLIYGYIHVKNKIKESLCGICVTQHWIDLATVRSHKALRL